MRHDWDGARVHLQVHSIETSQALGIDEAHVDAYANIARRVSDWALAARQARDVRHLVTGNGADMDKLLEAMQRAIEAYGIVLEQETPRTTRWPTTGGPRGRPNCPATPR